MKEKIRKQLEEITRSLFNQAGLKMELMPDFSLNKPKESFGDYSTNLALVLSKKLGRSPSDLSQEISEKIKDNFPGKIEIAGPGYINFYLEDRYFNSLISEIIEKGDQFGDNQSGRAITVNNEFISANPTGPMHLGNGRGGFLGDTISRVLRKNGFLVTNEYYVNDGGGQVMKLGHSVLKDDLAEYQGEYIDELHEKFKSETDVRLIGEKSATYILSQYIHPTTEKVMGIHFDVWASEKDDVLEKGRVEKALEIFKEKNLVFEQEGALWLKTTKFSDDKDRVLIKSNGERTYFANDCGYLLYKIERNFQRLILILGADHHGYLTRIRAAAKALGFEGQFDIFVVQLAKLVKNGQEVRMSKRAGNIVTIDELVEKVGLDVTRFFFLMYEANTHMTFDLGLAEEKSEKNPVYYVEYAHARIASLLKKASVSNFNNQPENKAEYIFNEKEKSLLRSLDSFGDLIKEVGETGAAHKLPYYVIGLADKFHSFYSACQIINKEDPNVTKERLRLALATKIVLKEALRLLGIKAPEEM